MSAVYTAERDGLVRMAAFVTGDVGAADELVQDAFADLYEAWPGVQTPTAWLRRAVTRRAVSWTRRRIVARRYLADVTLPEQIDAPDVVDQIRVREALGLLGPKHRAVVFCRYYLDLTEAQTAAELGIAPGTVKSRLSRALHDLEGALDER